MKNIKWVLFDIGGVIIHLMMQNPNGYTVGSRFFEPKVLEGLFYTKEYDNYMLGYISHEQFISKYLKKNKLDLSVEEFDEIYKKDVAPIPGMEQLVEKLAKQYKIALATNEGKMFTKYKMEGSGVLPYLSKIIASYLLREIKPSKQFYKKALASLKIEPKQCIFIDDTQINCDVAESLGIKSIVFKNAPQLEGELIKLGILYQ